MLLEESVVAQSFSCGWLFVIPWNEGRQASLSFTISWSLLKLMSIELVMSSNHCVLCHPFLLLPSVFPSIRVVFFFPSIRVFSHESALPIRWPKYLSFSVSISLPMHIQCWFPLGLNGLISPCYSRDSQATVQNTVQISYPYATTRKTIALTV